MKSFNVFMLAGFLSASILPATTFATTASKCSNPFAGVAEADSLSQLIRSNTAHYWNYVAHLSAKEPLRAFAKFEGIVVGDPHMANFSVIPVLSKAGRRSMKFVDIDLDDAGAGPFAYDFARLVVAVKSVNNDIKVKDLLDAYVQGLGGKSIDAPDKIQNALDMDMPTYDSLNADYVDKKTHGDSFKLKDGVLETYSAKYTKASIKTLFPGETVLDIATRPKTGGGSAGAVRIWVLVKEKSGTNRIDEIKGHQPSALTKLKSQKEPEALVADVQNVLLPEVDHSNYRLVKLGADLVWLRTKKLPMLDIPYGLKSADAISFVEDLSLFDANYLGLLHGRQAQGAAYLKSINKDQDAFREAVKAVTKTYLDKAEAKFED